MDYKESNVNERTYSQVTLRLPTQIVKDIERSQWYTMFQIKHSVAEPDENGLTEVTFYAHGIGRNLFTQRVLNATIWTFKSNL